MSAQLRGIARQLAASLALAYQAKRLYPEQHPERKKRAAQLHAAWTEAERSCPTVRVDFREARLHMGEQLSISIDMDICRELLAAARDAQLHEYTLHGPDAVKEALDMLNRLARKSRTGTAKKEASADEPAPAVNAAEPPAVVHHDDQVDMLRVLWDGIALHRRLDRELIGELARAVARTPGDGLIEPVQLRAAQDPALQLFEHTLNVAQLVYVAARTFAPGAQTAQQLIEAALLADIGMLSVPTSLVTRSERLEPPEFRLLRHHPSLGARWLLATPGVSEVSALVAFEHHMRSDGQGYPQTGRPWRPVAASCLYQVADVYAALRSPRPYRAPLAEDEARVLLRKLALRWLDEATVELLLTAAAPAGLLPGTPIAHFV